MRKIYTYYNGSECPVNKFLSKANKKVVNKFWFCIEYIRTTKNCLCEPYVKHFSLEKYSMLYELRIKIAGEMVRIIFYENEGNIYLLYAFYKRDSKDTQKALEAALKILCQIKDKDGEVMKEYREELVAV